MASRQYRSGNSCGSLLPQPHLLASLAPIPLVLARLEMLLLDLLSLVAIRAVVVNELVLFRVRVITLPIVASFLALLPHCVIPPVATHERASNPVCAARRAFWDRYD